ncbi:MAG: hypothetical protein WCO51_09855, partial [bacterium]
MKNIPNGSKRSYALLLAVLLAVTASLLLWSPIFKGEVFAPAKLLYHFEPWKQSAVVEPIPWNPLLWDGIAQFYVWRDFVWQTERSGYVPLWNPHQFCGAPMLANSQSAPLYPPHLLLAYFSTPIAITLAVLFYLWWAGFGASLLCWRLGGGLWPSLLAGIVFQLSTFFVSWLQLPSIPATASWYPWIVLATIGLFESPTWKRMAALGACIGLMLLAGHLQFAFYGLLLFGLLSAYLMLVYRMSGKSLRCCGLLIIGIILGFLLSLPQVLPALELSRHSHRQVVASEDGYFAYSALAMPLANLVTYFVPDFFGHPMDGDYWGWTNYAENALFVGIIPLLLALYGLFRRGGSREKWFFLTLIGIALLMALGTAINRFFYFLVPGFSSTGSPARVLVLAAFALAILSGLGLERMLRDSSEKSLKPLITLAGCMAVLLT